MNIYQGPMLFGFILAMLSIGGSVALVHKKIALGVSLLVVGGLMNIAMGEALFVAKLADTQGHGSLVSLGGYATLTMIAAPVMLFAELFATWVAMTGAAFVALVLLFLIKQAMPDENTTLFVVTAPLYERIFGKLPIPALVVVCVFIGFIVTVLVRIGRRGEQSVPYDPSEADQH